MRMDYLLRVRIALSARSGAYMKQHTVPIISDGSRFVRLKRKNLSGSDYNEKWLQDIVAEHPDLLPVQEIEPAFSNQVSICTELPTESGYCDHILINEDGYVTIVEYKLWRNPEARRKALSQIIDYAKDISQWSFSKFEENCLKVRNGDERSIYEILAKYNPEIDESRFIDNAQRNISSARFLLLLVGDGIRENIEELTSFLNNFGNMNFSLSMIEITVYDMEDGQILLIPRIPARTTEIVRSIIRIEKDGTLTSTAPGPSEKASTNSEREFMNRLARNRGTAVAQELVAFTEELHEQYGISPSMGRGKSLSYNLKSADDRFNFASIQETGEVWFYAIVTKTDELGDRSIGIDYLEGLARIVGAELDDNYSEWMLCVRRNREYLMIDEYLQHKKEWKDIIGQTLKRISDLEENLS